MDAGRLRSFVTIEQSSIGSPSPAGDVGLLIWSQIAQTYACVIDVSNRETQFAKGFEAQGYHKIIIRYQTGIDPACTRLNYDGRLYSITGARNCDERGNYANRNRWLTLDCVSFPDETEFEEISYLTLSEDDYLQMSEVQYLGLPELPPSPQNTFYLLGEDGNNLLGTQ